MKQFYVYILRDPRPGKDMQPIYVGKGRGGRARYHARKADVHYNRFLRNVLGNITKSGLKPDIEIVRYFEVEVDAFRHEVELIARYGRRDLKTGSLCNLTDGGEGTAGHPRPKASEFLRKLHTDPDFVKARDERIRAITADPARAKANIEHLSRLNTDPAFVKRASERMRQLHTDPKFSKAISDNIRKLNADPDFAKVNTDRFRKLNADPEWSAVQAKRSSARLSKLHTDPEYAKAHAERSREMMRKRMADPEYRAMLHAKKAAKRREAAG